ncbi:MAG: SH3 domain-containing protein [Lachnospira sp.]|nr:SH3 domain-containing protein [Lachnospira sp.]
MAKKKKRLNRRGKQVLSLLFTILVIILLIGGYVGIRLFEKYSPTKEHMDTEEYFADFFEDVSSDQVYVYLNDEPIGLKVLSLDGHVYLPREYVVENFNCRFYRDLASNSIQYTLADDILTYQTDGTTCTSLNGATTELSYIPVHSGTDFEGVSELYIDIDLVQEHADFDYRFYENPNRLFLYTNYEEKTYAKLTKNTAIRYRGGIKSPVIYDGSKGEEVEVLADLEDWVEVRTADGFFGYVSSKHVGDRYQETHESHEFVEDQAPSYISLGTKVNLVFQSIGGSAYNGEMLEEDLPSNAKVNVISPTWFSLSDSKGNFTSFANKDYVNTAHKMGLQVWALIDDFDSSVDKFTLFSVAENRANLIDNLMSSATAYGFDGINLDFEHIQVAEAEHYLQFIRELSMACEEHNLVLSIDNYTPQPYNEYYNRYEQGFWIDYSIIMGYDEYYAGSETAGPVASIGYVEEGIKNTVAVVDPAKVINAMPFYTRVWRETKASDGSITVSSKAVAMDDAADFLNRNGCPIAWDESTGMYYGSFEESSNVTVKVWLENEGTIEAKMKLYQQYGIAGVGGWRLGLENTATWGVINRMLP